ncbi:hypothetical protein IWX92DRAFT_432697 [Phyllosticta citricarpa]
MPTHMPLFSLPYPYCCKNSRSRNLALLLEWTRVHASAAVSAGIGAVLSLNSPTIILWKTQLWLPLRWTGDVRKSSHTRGTFTLLDAAAFATGCLNLSDLSTVPDFTCLSFYKIFGFPHLGALIIIRKSPEVAELIRHRRYFGGGTLEVLTALEESPLHSKKTTNYHSALEDGTPTYLSIFAIGHAIKTFNQFFTNMSCVPQHTASLTKHLWEGMVGFHHTNGKPLVRTYNHNTATCGDAKTQGATIAFNVLYPDGSPRSPLRSRKDWRQESNLPAQRRAAVQSGRRGTAPRIERGRNEGHALDGNAL